MHFGKKFGWDFDETRAVSTGPEFKINVKSHHEGTLTCVMIAFYAI